MVHCLHYTSAVGAPAGNYPCRDADPDKWGVAACTTDGQMFTQGDVNDYFSIQSSSKPITYGMALAERGEEFVHSYVGEVSFAVPHPVSESHQPFEMHRGARVFVHPSVMRIASQHGASAGLGKHQHCLGLLFLSH